MLNLHILLYKKEWLARASRINYWNTHKPVCFVLSYVLSVTQHLCNPSSHYRKYREYTHEHMPHFSIHESHNVHPSYQSVKSGSISEKWVCHYALFPAISNTLSNIYGMRSASASNAATKSHTEAMTHIP